MNDRKQLEWTRRDLIDGDPVWLAELGGLELWVWVPGTPWMWEWIITGADCIELARGDLCVMEDGEPVDDTNSSGDEWDYQDVELAQQRCERVAYALLATENPSLVPTEDEGSCPICRVSASREGLWPFCSAECLRADPSQTEDAAFRRRLAVFKDRTTGAGGPGGMVSSGIEERLGWYLAGAQDERAADQVTLSSRPDT